MSELEGRGVAWTEERGTSDEGRRRLQAPRRRAGKQSTSDEGRRRSEGEWGSRAGTRRASGGQSNDSKPHQPSSERQQTASAVVGSGPGGGVGEDLTERRHRSGHRHHPGQVLLAEVEGDVVSLLDLGNEPGQLKRADLVADLLDGAVAERGQYGDDLVAARHPLIAHSALAWARRTARSRTIFPVAVRGSWPRARMIRGR